MNFSQKIKNIRIEQGLTQKEFQSMIDINYSALQKYETGHVYPSYSALQKICKLFPQYTLSLIIDDIGIKQVHIKESSKKRIKPTKNRRV